MRIYNSFLRTYGLQHESGEQVKYEMVSPFWVRKQYDSLLRPYQKGESQIWRFTFKDICTY